MKKYTTVFIVESAHDPTEGEIKNVCDAILETGKQQGFEPWIVTATNATQGTRGISADRETYKKWERVP